MRTRSVKAHRTAQVGTTDIEWASDKQREAFSYGPAPLCVSGGFGSAKTWALCLKAIWLSDTFPGNRGVIARRLFEELKHTTMSTFFKVCPPDLYEHGGKRSDSEKYLRLNNGSEILWMHMDDPETENVVRGLEINWFFIDQAEEMDEALFDLLSSRLGRWDKAQVPEGMAGPSWEFRNRDGKPIVPTYAMLACNPDTELHWIYRRFHPDSEEHSKSVNGRPSYRDRGYRLITMKSHENKFLPKQNLDELLSKDATFVRRFVEGEWGIPEGQIHTIPPESMVDPHPELMDWIQNHCTLHRVLDHGDTSPTCCLWAAVDEAGNVIVYREYYRPDALISEHRRAITALSQGEKYDFQLADPSIFFKTMQKRGTRWSVADEYSDCVELPAATAIWWQRGHNDEMGTRNRINEHLQVDPNRIHPFTKQRGAPRLYFVRKTQDYPNGCEYVLRETRSQRRERIGTDLGRPIFSDERDKSITDHSYDCLRYLIASRAPRASVQKPTRPARSFAAVRKRAIEARRGGKFAEAVA